MLGRGAVYTIARAGGMQPGTKPLFMEHLADLGAVSDELAARGLDV